MIRFFNTYSGKSEEFQPLKAGEVRMYTCGPTVYDYAHIGNFRAFVFEDLLRRFLLYKGYKVHHVMNLTDVDDKTIAGANREGKSLADFTEKYTSAFMEDLKTLHIFQQDHENYKLEIPSATKHIPQMIELIQKLIQKGHAYEKDGSVYYRVSSFQNYGKLSKKDLSQNITGARVDVDEYEKEIGSDFALWKKKKEGEPSWPSPWGEGRPGWHVECSAMSMKYLDETFDIHAGGEDLIFPHHENEIAQSEGATGKEFVKYWLHCKHLLVNGEKMSKSKENFYTLRDLTKDHGSAAIRYALFSVHYRQSLNFTLEGLRDAKDCVDRLSDCYTHCLSLSRFGMKNEVQLKDLELWKYDLGQLIEDEKMAIENALSNDLNVSAALASFFDLVRHVNFGLSKKLVTRENLKDVVNFFEQMDFLLGLSITDQEPIQTEVLRLLDQRFAIRRDPNFVKDKQLQQLSDDLRKKIESFGWSVKDGKPGELSSVKKGKK